jgi:dephospho-CoA kinase
MMKNIAITGSFAAGKSFVLNCAKGLGYRTFSCDEFVRKLYENSDIRDKVVREIDGLEAFDQVKLSEIIYSDPEKRRKLELIIHPMVRSGIGEFERENKNQSILFTEVPLLFESNFDKYFAFSVCVFCSEQTRIDRAKARGVKDEIFFDKIKNAQMSQEEKKIRADFLLDSDNSEKYIKEALMKIIEKIVQI